MTDIKKLEQEARNIYTQFTYGKINAAKKQALIIKWSKLEDQIDAYYNGEK